MENTGPREEFIDRRGNLFVGRGIGVGEKNGTISLPGLTCGSPVKIAFAIGGEAEAFPPALSGQVDDILLALEIERQKGFYPFRGVLRFGEILRISVRAADFELLGENGLVIVVKGEKTLREESANSLLDFLNTGMHEAAAEGIARLLNLLGSHVIAELMKESASPENDNENRKSDDKWPKGLDEEGLHELMILETEII